MANTAFNHDPALTVAASNTTAGAAVKWVASKNLGESLIILDSGGNGRIGLAGDLDLITLTSGTVTVAGTVSATLIAGAAVKDEDNMASDSATHLASQQSIKAYVDANGGTAVAGTTDNGILTFVNSGSTFAAESNLTYSTDLSITSGNIVIATAGKGIDFSANSQSTVTGTTMASELLDWYEEGAWTPYVTDHDLNISESQTYATDGQKGYYTRVGNMVTASCRIKMASVGNLYTSAATRVIGLPFTSVNSTGIQPVATIAEAAGLSMTATSSLTGAIYQNGTAIKLQEWNTTTGTDTFSISELSNDGEFLMSITYFV